MDGDTGAPTDRAAEAAQIASAIRQGLLAAARAMPRQARTVLCLAWAEGLTPAEIAAVLGITPRRAGQIVRDVHAHLARMGLTAKHAAGGGPSPMRSNGYQ